MRIVYEKPPIYERACEVFDLSGVEPVFTYGDIIYNPHRNYLNPSIVAHEEIHSRQQGDDPALWWERYFTDLHFRLEQEIEAYQEQYKFGKKYIKNKDMLVKFLRELAMDLSSPMYGGLMSYQGARKIISS